MRVADFAGRKSLGDVRPLRQEQSNAAVGFTGVRGEHCSLLDFVGVLRGR